jgi:bifunctional NMN adenylyltransferase/nudix hydrolase
MTNNIVILLGSSFQPRTYKNPFTETERITLLKQTIKLNFGINCFIVPIRDTIYNDQAWAGSVHKIVNEYINSPNIGIIGHEKDESSYYLKLFPQWTFEPVELLEPLHAASIRELYFQKDANMNFIKGVVPAEVLNFLNQFKNTTEYQDIIKEKEFIEAYKSQYASLPYSPIFVTADACVIQSGHVLMVKRRAMPGKNLMALPGGYVNANSDKSVKDAAIRELREETSIKVPEPVLRGSIVKSKVFDAIGRSQRGRIITHCFMIQLPTGPLPKVKGGDDAYRAKWVPIGGINPEECFEDHYELILWAIGG